MSFFKVSKFFLFLAPFAVILVSVSTLFPFIVVKYSFFRTVVDLAWIFFLAGLIFGSGEETAAFKTKFLKLIKSPLFIAVSVFVLVFLLACLFAFDSQLAFWSNFERGEGGFQILHFYLFFLLLLLVFENSKDWKKIFNLSLIAGTAMVSYGILAGLGIQGFVGPAFGSTARFGGSLGNSAYVGAYLLFILFYLFFVFGEKKAKISKIALVLLALFFFVFIWLAETRGPVLGLAAGFVAFAAYLIFNKNFKWRIYLAVGLALFLILGFVLVYFHNSKFVASLPGARLFNLSLTSSSFASRIWTWGSALAGFSERPILGWGPENFSVVFDKYFNPKHFIPGENSETWYDRAHDVFLDYLVETGFLGFLSYILIFVVFYFEFFKGRIFEVLRNESMVQNALFFALPIAYLVQGVIIFDVLPIYLNLFLFLAFAVNQFGKQENNKKQITNNK